MRQVIAQNFAKELGLEYQDASAFLRIISKIGGAKIAGSLKSGKQGKPYIVYEIPDTLTLDFTPRNAVEPEATEATNAETTETPTEDVV